jgi:arylsulfatase A-like enzyme
MRRIALLVSAVLLLAAVAASVKTMPQGSHIAGVVIVTLDTTRADHLSPYGFMDARMPHLERLAREGVLFNRALTVAPLTLPAHTSILTGLLPASHGVRDNADGPLAERYTTLAEMLQQRGFRTGAFVGSIVLQADRGLSQGFATYQGVRRTQTTFTRQRPGDEVMNEAIAWLEQNAKDRFLLWAHLYDAHAPYDPPEPYRSRVADPYVGELLFQDAQIGRLLDTLDRLKLKENTIVVVVGDHGEGLGEHGEAMHGEQLYNSVLRVPFIVRAPGVRPGTITDVVRLVDVLPTVVSLLGVPAPASDGVSLLPALQGEHMDLEAYAESLYPARLGGEPRRALSDGRFKLILGGGAELYDLDHDPFEERNLIIDRPRTANAMRTRLTQLTRVDDVSRLRAQRVSPELRERLAALGYFDGAARHSR